MFKKIWTFFPTLILVLTISLHCAQAQNSEEKKANYRLAERFSPDKLSHMMFSTSIRPNWLRSGERFWYSYKTSEGERFYLVDPDKKTKTTLFDNHDMARQLTMITRDPYDHQNLPPIQPEFVKDDKYFRFSVFSTWNIHPSDKQHSDPGEEQTDNDGETSSSSRNSRMERKEFYLEYDIATGRLYEVEKEEKVVPRPWANVSPDSTIVLFARDFNLFWMDKENYLKALNDENDSTIVEHQLTFDGLPDYGFGQGYTPNMNDDENTIEKERKMRRRPGVFWSPDSRKFAMIRNDTRGIQYLWVINSLSAPRPTLEPYRFHMPGEAVSAEAELWVFDMKAKRIDTIPVAAFQNQSIQVQISSGSTSGSNNNHAGFTWLSPSSDEVYFTRISRDLKRLDHCRANLRTGEVTVLIEERMNTYVDHRPLHLMENNREIIHWSERDGWGHFYLYDTEGNLRNQITSGPWYVERLLRVDEKNRIIYFTAKGREPEENPYFTHLYQVGLDGKGLQLLNPGNYDHSVFISRSSRYFVNNFSRVDTAPRSELRNNRGELVMELETADLSSLTTAGYRFPEPFRVKAADGITDLYGVMYKPFDFDPGKKYPLIMFVYPGPHTELVNTTFSTSMDQLDRLAQIGFVVVSLGNRGGSPNRSKWYHNYGYGNIRDFGLADKKYGAEQLADRHPYIDIENVGIFGHSGGGFMTVAAMLQFPDFFKVGVASAGNHDNHIYNRWWTERHQGVREIVNNKGEVEFLYEIENNAKLAANLRGKLLLTTGDRDNNVHPANTFRLADALMKAHKRFDMFVFPGQAHFYGPFMEYNFWLTADYFAKHLIGDYSISTDIFEMRREHKLNPGNSRSQ
jgi:dipeptidyl-peptidase 4